MKLRNHIIRCVVVLALTSLKISAGTTVPQMTITGPDGEFTHIELPDGLTIEHILSEDGGAPVMILNHPQGKRTELGVDRIGTCEPVAPNIPALSIHFPDYPDAEQIWMKETYIDATLDIHGNGAVEDQEGLTLTIKGRGNSTWGCEKKPMRLKFSKKTSLCGFKKAKNYVLLANYLDRTHAFNALALWLAGKTGVAYTNHYQPCDVFINNKYAGLFLLTEKIGINSASIDIDEESGIFFELSTEYDEDFKFRSARYNLPVMAKDPDFTELAENDAEGRTAEDLFGLWKEDFEAAEEQAYNGNGEEYFDIESLARYLLVINVTGNMEMYSPKSLYIHKAARGTDSRYVFGPVWDFDSSFNSEVMKGGEPTVTSPEAISSMHKFIVKLKSLPSYKEYYTAVFDDFYNNIYPEMLDYLDEYTQTIETSAELDGRRWVYDGEIQGWIWRRPSSGAREHAAKLKEWLTKRVEFLKKRIDRGIV